MSHGQKSIQATLQCVAPGTPRHTILLAAKRFKASWVDLGQELSRVRQSDSWRAWGHDTFEAYCQKELRLKPETANKLTRSFAFLKEHAPSRLATNDVQKAAPALDVVDMLSRARERSNVSEAALDALAHEVLGGHTVTSKEAVLRRLRQNDPQAFMPKANTPAHDVPQTVDQTELRKALLLAERLVAVIEPMQHLISAAGRHHSQTLVKELQTLFKRHPKSLAAAGPQPQKDSGSQAISPMN